jgi:PAS domain S-box-containing protein
MARNPLFSTVNMNASAQSSDSNVISGPGFPLQESYRLLFDANPNPMYVLDAETFAFLAVNDAALEQYGYSREEFLRMNARDFRPAEDVERFVASAQGIAGERPTFAGMFRHRRKDGKLLDVEISASAVVFQGRPARLAVALNVTDGRAAEHALRESQTRLALLLDTAPSGIVIHGADGRVSHCNAAAEELLGVTAAETEGRTLRDPGWHFLREDRTVMPVSEFPVAQVLSRNEAATNLYRIAQEAVHNAVRHGKPTRIEICLTQDGGEVTLEVRDNGSGIKQGVKPHKGLGLAIMRYRTDAINATCRVEPAPPGGTVVRCLWRQPVHSKARADGRN